MRTKHAADLKIIMTDPVRQGSLSFEEYHKILSSKTRTIAVQYQNRHLFEINIPPSIFNPITSRSTKTLTEIILSGDIPVGGSRFIDLGCGCGIIGLAAALKSAKSVLYTDINPQIDFLKSHPKFRTGADRVETQSFCSKEAKNSADIVFFSIPSRVRDQRPHDQSIQSAYSRDIDFIPTMLENISKILVQDGQFVFWYGIHPQQVRFFSEFMILLGRYFDPGSLCCLLEHQFDDGYTSTIYAVKKKVNQQLPVLT